jgi:hypothetical protein
MMAVIVGTPQDDALTGTADGDSIFGFGRNDRLIEPSLGKTTHTITWRTLGGFLEAQPGPRVVAAHIDAALRMRGEDRG